jgi:hypothetical protein
MGVSAFVLLLGFADIVALTQFVLQLNKSSQSLLVKEIIKVIICSNLVRGRTVTRSAQIIDKSLDVTRNGFCVVIPLHSTS